MSDPTDPNEAELLPDTAEGRFDQLIGHVFQAANNHLHGAERSGYQVILVLTKVEPDGALRVGVLTRIPAELAGDVLGLARDQLVAEQPETEPAETGDKPH